MPERIQRPQQAVHGNERNDHREILHPSEGGVRQGTAFLRRAEYQRDCRSTALFEHGTSERPVQVRHRPHAVTVPSSEISGPLPYRWDINQIHNNVNVTGRFRLILSSGNRSPDGICTTGLGLVVSPKLFSGDFLRGGEEGEWRICAARMAQAAYTEERIRYPSGYQRICAVRMAQRTYIGM